MKTAMQELEDWVNNHQEPIFGMDLEIKINELLEKEKEQAIDLIKETAMFVSAAETDKDIAKLTYEDVYTLFYNQNK